MSAGKKRFDKTYFENILYKEIPNSQRNKNRLKEILKHKASGRLLEIGCGKGEFLKLAMKYFDVQCIDISSYAANSIKPIFGNRVRVGNIEKVNLTRNHYDVIVAFNILEHTKKPYLVIKKIYNSLKRDGILIGSVPNNFPSIGGFGTWIIKIFIDRTHYSIHSLDYWHKWFKEVKFKKITFFGEVIFNRNHSKYVKNSFWKYVSLNLMFLCKK